MGYCKSKEDLNHKAEKLRKELNLQALVVTRGEKGLSLFENKSRPIHIPANTKDVYDVTGAGDTVLATIGLSIGYKQSFKKALYLSNISAGIVVGKLGTSFVSKDELIKSIFNEDNFKKNKIYNLKNLKLEIDAERKKGAIVVMTNGCFDILHPGHLDYLKKSKSFGNLLIVAINDDNSISRIKGCRRPINNLNFRLRMLASLEFVDYLISFSEDTPENLYKYLLPDILVKGNDYANKEIIGSKSVLKNGGAVKLVELLPGFNFIIY